MQVIALSFEDRVRSLDDLKLAPFHLLATEGAVHTNKNHDWHMQALAKICAADPKMLLATPYRVVALDEPNAVNDAVRVVLSPGEHQCKNERPIGVRIARVLAPAAQSKFNGALVLAVR